MSLEIIDDLNQEIERLTKEIEAQATEIETLRQDGSRLTAANELLHERHRFANKSLKELTAERDTLQDSFAVSLLRVKELEDENAAIKARFNDETLCQIVQVLSVEVEQLREKNAALRAELDVQICKVVELGGTDKIVDTLMLAKLDAAIAGEKK